MFVGSDVWTDGENYYVSDYNNENCYQIDILNNIFVLKEFSIIPDSRYIWSDGNNIYYSNNSNQYDYQKVFIYCD